jgi:Lon protease-like protein
VALINMVSNIPLFPLSHGVFPDGMLVLQIFEVRYLDLIKRSHQQQLPFGVVWLKKGREVQVPSETPLLHAFGCLAHIKEFEQLQANLYRVICQGGARFTLHDTQPGPFGVWQGEVTYLPDDPEVQIPESLQQHADRLGKVIATAQQQGQSQRLPIFAPFCLDQCGWVANRYAEAMSISSAEKMNLLCELDPLQRMQKVDLLLRDA